MIATEPLDFPFQIHSSMPPVSLKGSAKSSSVLFRSPITSIKFDFPEPFGPMRTFSGLSSTSAPRAPKESRFSIRNL